MKRIGTRAVALLAMLGLYTGCASRDAAPDGASEATSARRAEPLLPSRPWVLTALLAATDSDHNNRFGAAVSVSSQAIVVGALSANALANNQGLAYAYVRSAFGWTLAQQLIASDGVAGDRLGWSVAVSGDTVLLGAPGLAGVTTHPGAAYVFVRSGGIWTEQAKLMASDGTVGDQLGVSVALEGDTAMIGADHADAGAGAVYVYARSGTSWGSEQKLTNAAVAHFGHRVAFSGSVAAIAGDTQAQAFRLAAGAWSDQETFPVSSSKGLSVSVSAGQTLISGMLLDHSGPDWVETVIDSAFTTSVISGDTVVAIDSTARIYQLDGNAWPEVRGIGSTDLLGYGYAYFEGVSLSENLLALGGSNNIALDGYEFDRQVGVFEASLVCSGDTGCPDAAYCAASGYCAPRKRQATACDTSAGADCKQAACRACEEAWSCVDGVCCDRACEGGCEACSQAKGGVRDGVCSTLARGQPGECGGGLTCNGGSANCEHCASDGDCPLDTLYCAADGTCQPQKPSGSACDAAAGADCKGEGCRTCAGSSNGDRCIAGVCCNASASECTGCMACLAALTGAADGTCAPVSAGTDPNDVCGEDPRETCDADGLCDGLGACRIHSPVTRVCGDATCTGGMLVGRTCNGGHTCDYNSVSCAPFICGQAACTTSCSADDECAPGAHCSAASVCEVAGADAGTPATGSCSDCRASSGCGCRIGAPPRSGSCAAILLALGLVRRRRRHAPGAAPP